MLFTADQIVCHLVGDYLLQSDWMAQEKVKRFLPAVIHALTYSLGFLFLRPSLAAWLVMVVTHFLIDRYRLARYVVWVKNFLAPGWLDNRDGYVILSSDNPPWSECTATGYPPERPAWMAVWLLVIADNTLHLLCNGLALRFL